MMIKNYQRKFLRAPLKGPVLFADGSYVLRAHSLNISEGGMLIDELPSFPESDDVPLMLAIPQLPSLRNLTLLKMQTFSLEIFPKHIIRVKAKMVRRHHLSQNLDNLFRASFGLEFLRIAPGDQKYIEEYVKTFSSNVIYLQTLIDAFNTDEETRQRVRALARIMGYQHTDKIAQLRSEVGHDYKSLQWL